MRVSVRTKLLIAFFGTIAVAYLAIVSIFSNYETKVLQKRALDQLTTEATYSVEKIRRFVQRLMRQTIFLSHLEIMDDVIAKDIDRRIVQLLQKKKHDIGHHVQFIVFDTQGVPVASTMLQAHAAFLHRVFSHVKQSSKPFVFERYIIFATPIYASFDTKKLLGSMVLLLPIEELGTILHTRKHVLAWIVPPRQAPQTLHAIFPAPPTRTLAHDYLFVYKPLEGVLRGWRLGYALDKSVAFETVRQVKSMLFLTFVVILLLISILILVVDRKIVEPIRRLSAIASKIVPSNNYTAAIRIDSKDEIGELAENFNRLMQKVAQALRAIEMQNQKTVQTLINLMDFFAQMVQSDTKEQTIERACKELQRLTKAQRVWYAPEIEDAKVRIIFLQSHLQDRDYGYIHIQAPKEQIAMEERFFEAAGRMISLQIDKIELLKTTKEALRSKTSFFSALSHELRTPLGSILSLSQFLITSSDCDAKTKESLGKIESSASHLLQIINDILLIAKAESGKLEPHIQSCDIVALCKETIEMLEPLAQAKEIPVVFTSNHPSLVIATDPKLLRQILINLLANSIKYTQQGSIRIRIDVRGDWVTVCVEDTGIGIEPEFLHDIFKEFHREYRIRNESTGSGLGLALSKKIAKVLGGDLVIESAGKDKGTTAFVHLPRSKRFPHVTRSGT